MIVVADTSPLNYLIQIECENLLPQHYGRILVPIGVMRELGQAGAPARVLAWGNQLPAWVDVRTSVSPSEFAVAFLGLGEREAIQLAEEEHADLLLIDERKGQQEARRRGLRTTGTLRVLLDAGEFGLIDPGKFYRRLIAETTFRTWAKLEAHFYSQVRRDS